MVFICIIFILLVILWLITTKKKSNYKKIFSVKNLNELREHFVLDNPNEDGTDPTGGNVDYSFLFPKDKDNKIINNINGDPSWSEIPDNKIVSNCFQETDDSIVLKISENLTNDKVGSFRLSSRKLFRGGLFIIDVEHIPIGCGVWPAFWLNGFVGAKDQYHMSPKNPEYKKNMDKLVKYTLGNEENFNHTCHENETLLPNNKSIDFFMSAFLEKNIYPAMWPVGGEIDIIEQTNFSPTNLISIHGGPKCEVTSEFKSNYMSDWISPQYKQFGLRSVCGNTYEPLGKYSGCKNDAYAYGENGELTNINGFTRPNCPEESAVNAGNSQIKGPYGSFGEPFNANKGGVYAVQWIPKKRVNIWFYPTNLFSKKNLSLNNGPLSDYPNPKTWKNKEIPDIKNVYLGDEKYKTLLASYVLDDKNAMTEGCDFNFQALIINITFGGGWGGSSIPKYCSVDGQNFNAQNYHIFLNKCFHEDPDKANSKGIGVHGCYDGAYNKDFRGEYAQPIFFKEAFFKFKSIHVFQNPHTDENVW